jgi:hypothetical protein
VTDPFDTVREGLASLSPPFGTLPKARTALASIERERAELRALLQEKIDEAQPALDEDILAGYPWATRSSWLYRVRAALASGKDKS